MADVHEALVKIIFEELGQNSAELFTKFYRDFPKEEQINGAQEILKITIGDSRTKDLIKKVDISNAA